MKVFIGFSACILGFIVFETGSLAANKAKPLHIDLEASGYEYRTLMEKFRREGRAGDAPLDKVLAAGKRNLDWIEQINSFRTPETQLQLSSAETQVGYPITGPTLNNERLVLEDFAKWQEATPAEVVTAILGSDLLPNNPPISDADFIILSRKIDRLYQRASRWLLQQPSMPFYRLNAKSDVRGYYFLGLEPDLETKLAGWRQLPTVDQDRLSVWLLGQCANDENTTVNGCKSQLATAVTTDQVPLFFAKYRPVSEKLYKEFFDIPAYRTDVTWDPKIPSVMSVPFANPHVPAVLNWLRDNIEDEWQWLGWKLKLDFVESDAATTTHVEFKAGATPHVNELAGSIITMDANRSLSEYNSRWTIRHEYGHVLGFPDCYIEFYDESIEAMISYQLDITNLMCSRRGHLQQKHFDELKRVYLKQ